MVHRGDWDVLGTGSTGYECWAVGTQGTVPHGDQGAPGIKVSLDQGALGCPWGPGVQRGTLGSRCPGALLEIGFPGVSAGFRVFQETLGTSLSLGIPGSNRVMRGKR